MFEGSRRSPPPPAARGTATGSTTSVAAVQPPRDAAALPLETTPELETPPGQRTQTQRRKRRPRRIGRMFLGLLQGLVLTAVTPIFAVMVALAPSVFLVYGEKRHIEFFFPGMWPWWLPAMFFCTAYRTGGKEGGNWGIVVAVRHTDSQMREDGRIAARYARFLVRLMLRCKAAALAGQLPNFVEHGEEQLGRGRQIPVPFVPGDTGTLYAMLQAALRGAKELGQQPSDLVIAVPGGAGRIGGRLVELLRQEFSGVIAYDRRYGKLEVDGNVMKTSDPSFVSDVDLVLALTPKGSDLEPLVEHVGEGVLFMDDTHPDIPKSLRKALRDRGVILRKPSVSRRRFRWWPLNLPGYRRQAIPGCLVEAFVVAAHGRGVLDNFQTFVQAAQQEGFEPILFEHPDVV